MATSILPPKIVTLVGAPDADIGSRSARPAQLQAMQLDLTQDMMHELLGSIRTGQAPQILFGRTPTIKCGDKTHSLRSSSESNRYELYRAGDVVGSLRNELAFATLVHHSLAVQRTEELAAPVDAALAQLRSSMAAVAEWKEANKTLVGDAAPVRTPGHRRIPSKNFGQHLTPSGMGSPLLNAPSSPVTKRPPTSQPSNTNATVLSALRIPLIHLLAVRPAKERQLAEACRTSLAIVRDLLPKIAKRLADDSERWQLTDKSFRELDPWKFPYKPADDRQQAIDHAVKSFDRLRLSKDDRLWQTLLPQDERGQGKCISRLNVKAPDTKPATPLHKMPKLNEKKLTKKPAEERKTKDAKESETKQKFLVKERPVKLAKVNVSKSGPAADKPTASKPPAVVPPNRYVPSQSSKIRTKKVPATETSSSSPHQKPKMNGRNSVHDRGARSFKPAMPVNTKPKNPSPLSASPPVNASDFEDDHPVHKALSAAPSPSKASSGNSDRSLKRKANDIDSGIHNHDLDVKKHRLTPLHTYTPAHGHGRSMATPSSNGSLKRKSDESSSSTPGTKIRKVGNIDTTAGARYQRNAQISPGGSSSSQTSPTVPNLSFRQTVELSQKFQQYYKKYEDLYWQLSEAAAPPTDTQRTELLRMHKKLEEMKKEIRAGAGAHR